MYFFDKKVLQKGKNWCIVKHHLREYALKGVYIMARIKFENEAEAIDALNNSFLKFEAAVNYLTAQNPNHPALAPFKGRDVNEIKEERARDVIQAMNMDDEFWAASSYMQQVKEKSKENAQAAQVAERAEDAVKQENNINLPPENSEAVERNQAYLTQKFAELEEADENGEPKWHALTADVRSKIHAVDDDNSHSDELQKKTEETIWETTKAQIFSTRAFDFNFMGLNERDKASLLKNDVADVYAEHAANIVGVTPVLDEKQDENQELIQAAKARAEASLAAINDFLAQNNAEKAAVKKSAVIASAVHASKKLDNVVAFAKSKNYSKKAVAGFKLFGNKFSEKMKTFWGNAYSGAKEYVNNNKTRLVVDALATTAVALSPVTYPVVAAYAAYATVGAIVWPIVEKKNKMKNALKRQGQPAKGLGGFAGLKKAWNALKGDEKEWKRYKNRALTGAAAGVVVGGVLGAASTYAIQGVTAATTKAFATVTRAASSVTSQFMNYHDAKKLVKEEDNAENRANLKSSKWGLIIGGAIAAVSAAFGINNILNGDSPEVDTNGMGGNGGNGNPPAQGIIDEGNGGGQGGGNNGGGDVPPAQPDVTVPDAWDSSMGITERQWNEMQNKFTGIFENHAVIFGMDDKTPASTWQNIYNNIHNAQENGILSQDMTTEQIMYKYMKLIENTERVEKVPGTKFLRTALDADGKPMYYVDAKEMAALNDIILCGKTVEVSAEDLTKSLNRITDNGSYVGEGAGIGQTYNRFVGFGRGEDCPDGTKNVNAWEQGHAPRAPKVVEPEAPKDGEFDHKEVKPADARPDGSFDHVKFEAVETVDGKADQAEITDNLTTGTTATDQGSNDLDDPKALGNTKPGATGKPISGTTRTVTPKSGGRGSY